LPKNEPISEFASLMDASMLNNAINHMDSVYIQLSLPSWEYAYSIDNMYPELSALGMGIAFSDKADFSKMYNTGNASITKAVHKTYIKVNEEGTEAAAVTAIGVETAAAFNPPVNFNRPFLYTIIEKQTGIITFVGIVNNPSQH
jgi:serine protease inhibitor